MLRQIANPSMGLTARVEVVGAETTALDQEDIDFLATLAMVLALSPRRDISRVRAEMAGMLQGMERGW